MQKIENEGEALIPVERHKLPRLAYSIDEFCETFGISRALYYDLATAGKVKPSKILSRTVITANEIKRFAASLEVA